MDEIQNIAVLGAGIMGLSAAYMLSQRGHSVTIFDPAGTARPNASAMAGGMLAPYAEIEHMPPSWITAGLSGIQFWAGFAQAHSIGFQQNGSLLIAHEDDRYILERFRRHLPPVQQNTTSTTEIEPDLSARFPLGLHLPEEAHLNPEHSMAALRESIHAKGGVFVNAEYTPKDSADSYDHMIDCRGMGAIESDPDLRGVKGETLLVRNEDFTLARPVRLMHPRYPLYIVPRDNGVFMIGATVIESADHTVTLRSSMELMSALYTLHPSFGEAEIIKIQAGIRPAYPDNLPRLHIQKNVIRCNGLFRHGYLLAPVMARCVADYIDNIQNEHMNLFRRETDENHPQRTDQNIHRAA